MSRHRSALVVLVAKRLRFWVESRRRQRRRKTLDRKSWPLMGNDGARAREPVEPAAFGCAQAQSVSV